MMKPVHTLLLFLLPLFVSPCQGQARADGDYAGAIRVLPVTFAERGDSLLVELDVIVSGEAIGNRQGWTTAPVLTAGDTVAELPFLLINGRQKSRLYHRKTVFGNTALSGDRPSAIVSLPYGTDTVVRYRVAVPYELWMDRAMMVIKQELFSPAGKKQLFVTGGFGQVALEPHSPYAIDPRVDFITPEHENKERRMQGQAFLDFQVGRSVIIPGFRRNPEELAKIADAVNKVLGDDDVEITGLYIEGYASPEGSYSLNERLSRERSTALCDYMIASFDLDPALFRVSSVAEDWDGLRMHIEGSNVPQKDKIFAIIDSEDDFDRKEARLRALGGPWRTMITEIFPSLRRVEYQIDFTVKDYSVEESRRLAGRNPHLLSQRELFVLAQSYPAGSPERDEVFEVMFRQYPDQATAVINSAALMLERGEGATAKRYLDRVEGDPRAFNNLGVYWLTEGDTDRAEEYFTRALAEGVGQALHNLEEVRKKREDDRIMERYQR